MPKICVITYSLSEKVTNVTVQRYYFNLTHTGITLDSRIGSIRVDNRLITCMS